MSRKKMNPRSDQRIFKSTVDRSKLINIKPIIMRGGIRL